MENNQDFEFIKERFDSLPAITLPESLTAQRLWARVDAGDLAPKAEAAPTQTAPAPPQSKVLAFVRRYRPVLSYAAVFVVMVVVYYSAGLDNSPVQMQQLDAAPAPAAAPMPMMAAPAPQAKEEAPQAAPRMTVTESAQDAGSGESTLPPKSSMMAENPDVALESDLNGAALADINYQQALDRAVAMEKHLIDTLSPRDYGGIYVGTEETVRLHIWAVNPEAVNASINSYTGESCEVVLETARCSLEEMKLLQRMLNRIGLQQGETLATDISQWDNTVAVNISKDGEARLRGEIDMAVKQSAIPAQCVTIVAVEQPEENPIG